MTDDEATQGPAGQPGDIDPLAAAVAPPALGATPEAPQPEPVRDLRRVAKAAARLAVIGVIAAAILVGFRHSPVAEWLSEENVGRFRSVLGPAAGPVWAVAYGVLIGFWVPGSPLTALGAALFPQGQAVLWNYVGAVAGAVVGFVAARWLGRDAARTLFGKRFPLFDRYELLFEKRGFEAVLYLRMLPTPYTLISWVGGMSPLRLSTYTFATALGILPGSIAFTLLLSRVVGALRTGDWWSLVDRTTVAAVGIYLLMLTVPIWFRVAQRRWGWFKDMPQ